jgi:hypothetical protein
MTSDNSTSTASQTSSNDTPSDNSTSTASRTSDDNTQKDHHEVTPCPSSIDDPQLDDQSIWNSYDNALGSELFHGGNQGFLENVHPSPEKPQQECFYDKSGDLIDKDHEYSGVRGTANQYDGHHGDYSEKWDHIRHDTGGIWENGREAFSTSMEYHANSAVGEAKSMYENSWAESAVEKAESIYEHYWAESAVEHVDSMYEHSWEE